MSGRHFVVQRLVFVLVMAYEHILKWCSAFIWEFGKGADKAIIFKSLFTGVAKAIFCNVSFLPSEEAVLNLVLIWERSGLTRPVQPCPHLFVTKRFKLDSDWLQMGLECWIEKKKFHNYSTNSLRYKINLFVQRECVDFKHNNIKYLSVLALDKQLRGMFKKNAPITPKFIYFTFWWLKFFKRQ